MLILISLKLYGSFKIGYQTPKSSYGENLVLEMPNVEREIVN